MMYTYVFPPFPSPHPPLPPAPGDLALAATEVGGLRMDVLLGRGAGRQDTIGGGSERRYEMQTKGMAHGELWDI